MSEPAPKPEGDLIHRLKNHLCIVVGFCDLVIADLPSGDRHRADLMEVHKAAMDAMAMMDELSAKLR